MVWGGGRRGIDSIDVTTYRRVNAREVSHTFGRPFCSLRATVFALLAAQVLDGHRSKWQDWY